MDTHELSWLGEDFNPGALDHETKAQAVKYLLDACPVAHGTDVRGDYYVVTKHRDVLRVMQEWTRLR